MELKAVQAVAVPRERVWAEIGDPAALAERLKLRSLDIEDPVKGAQPAIGREWRAAVDVTGTRWTGVVRVHDMVPPERIDLHGDFEALALFMRVMIAAPAPAESLVDLTVTARGAGLRGKMLLQTLKLMRPALEEKLTGRLADCARQIEAAHG